MNNQKYRLEAFSKLGNFLTDSANKETLEEWAYVANSRNNWFTPANVLDALHAIGNEMLAEDKLRAWVSRYEAPKNTRKIGVVMAGNIPAVGFHDALSVLISGHVLLAKTSKDDDVLIRFLLQQLVTLAPEMASQIEFVERINEADAYIATGSDNTARYFEYYFSKKPHIIRKNRTSVAVLTGEESDADLKALGKDILQYYGLGCRNVSKVYVPKGYDFTRFYEAIEDQHNYAANHHKYFNNYEYNKSILLINGVPHLDNGFLMIQENTSLVSPLSVLYYEEYTNIEDVHEQLANQIDKVQCIVSNTLQGTNVVGIGAAQCPTLMDYADGVDVMQFLSSL